MLGQQQNGIAACPGRFPEMTVILQAACRKTVTLARSFQNGIPRFQVGTVSAGRMSTPCLRARRVFDRHFGFCWAVISSREGERSIQARGAVLHRLCGVQAVSGQTSGRAGFSGTGSSQVYIDIRGNVAPEKRSVLPSHCRRFVLVLIIQQRSTPVYSRWCTGYRARGGRAPERQAPASRHLQGGQAASAPN